MRPSQEDTVRCSQKVSPSVGDMLALPLQKWVLGRVEVPTLESAGVQLRAVVAVTSVCLISA